VINNYSINKQNYITRREERFQKRGGGKRRASGAVYCYFGFLKFYKLIFKVCKTIVVDPLNDSIDSINIVIRILEGVHSNASLSEIIGWVGKPFMITRTY
jgi:hypothetical protein